MAAPRFLPPEEAPIESIIDQPAPKSQRAALPLVRLSLGSDRHEHHGGMMRGPLSHEAIWRFVGEMESRRKACLAIKDLGLPLAGPAKPPLPKDRTEWFVANIE